MSKMLKLLNKASNHNHPSMFIQDHGVLGREHQGMSSAEGMSKSRPVNRHHNVMVNFPQVFMAFVAMIAVSSILMSYKVFTQMNLSRDMSQQMMSAYGSQSEKISDLEKAVLKMDSNHQAQVVELKTQIQALNNSIKENQSKTVRISEDVNKLRSSVEDVKASHRLMVDKYKEINNTVQDLQSGSVN